MLYNKSIRALDYATPTHGFFYFFNTMNDYKEILKTLLLRYYSPHPIGVVEKQYKTTSQVLYMAQGIIPSEPIDQHDIYDVLQELGFTIELVEMPDNTLVYCWCLYRKASH